MTAAITSTLRATFTNGAGAPTNADDGTAVTVTVASLLRAPLASLSSEGGAVRNPSAGTYEATFAGPAGVRGRVVEFRATIEGAELGTTEVTHPLLSADAREKAGEELLTELTAAAAVLGLAGVPLGEELLEQAEIALARQVNYQVALGPDGALYQSEKEGDQEKRYRGSDGPPPAEPLALAVAQRVLDAHQAATATPERGTDGWRTLRSVR